MSDDLDFKVQPEGEEDKLEVWEHLSQGHINIITYDYSRCTKVTLQLGQLKELVGGLNKIIKRMEEFRVWTLRVEAFLKGEDAYNEALKHEQAETLLELRNDEPYDAFVAGDEPALYAKFLLDEWKLFGPGGV